nr:RecName: Full=Laccase [Agaricus placomyces]
DVIGPQAQVTLANQD